MNEFMFDQKFPGEVFSGDAPIPLTDFMGRQQTTPGYEAEFLIDPSIETEDITDESKFKRFNPYQDLAEPLVPGVSDPKSALELIEMGLTRTKPPYQEQNIEAGRPRYEDVFSDQGPQIALGEGGNPAVEEAGIMSALLDPRIDLPSSEEQGLVRESARTGSEGAAMYYPEGSPTFEQVLMDQYGYPDVEREIYGASTTEQMRAARPRHDMPTYQELEDARSHALQTALMAKDMGPETATKVGGIGEMFDRYMPILGTATDADVVMDKRNNAFGAQLLQKAGVDATPQELTRLVDQAVFDQLDVVLGREPGERRFKSPPKGIDIFFPRDAQGFFDINRYD
tara:strand:- start:5 stop:1024 length:1020 start_codon:yes stop_codon:yes gene_type:complete